ncbi:MAG TPA: hypothetical protein PLF11_00055 [Bacillota bacterium]|nr:hypothetical protein [Dermatophilaceae bacterium]HOI35751.1 hypothetical protein [Bacillota bacterium]
MALGARTRVANVVRSPSLFAEHVLGEWLWSKQREVLDALIDNERVAVRSCHGIGKTFLASVAVVWFLYTHKPAIVVTTAPTWDQVERLLWKEVAVRYRALPPELQALSRPPTTKLELSKDHLAYGRSTNEPEKFQGIHAPNLMIVVDEASGVDDAIFTAIDSCSAGGKYRELLIGNAINAEGKFYRAFQNPALGYAQFRISIEDTPNWTGENVPDRIKRSLVQPDRVRQWAEDWGADSGAFRARVYAEFPTGLADNILIPLTWVERAISMEPPDPAEFEGVRRVLAVDPAHSGGDRTAFAATVGYNLFLVESMSGAQDTQTVVGTTRRLVAAVGGSMSGSDMALTERVQLVVDPIGIGAGVYDLLKAAYKHHPLVNVVPHYGHTTPRDRRLFRNARDEAHWAVRRMFESGLARVSCEGPPMRRFVAQASALRFSYDALGRITVESKDEMKARGLPSPDELDAVVMAFRAPMFKQPVAPPRMV